MTLWFAMALMTAAAVFAVLWPLGRPRPAASSGGDLAVYRDQLDEVERDATAGRIGTAEAEAARLEVSRRLIAAADAAPAEPPPAPAPWPRRIAALAAIVALPIGAGSLYYTLGSPGLPGVPVASRLKNVPQQPPLTTLVAQVEAHLASNPDEGRGWEVIAPVYVRLGRFDDAVKARRNALRLLGETATRQADLGEALVAAANGVVTAEAKAAFERAIALDAKEVKARFFIGLADEQDGRKAEAADAWRALLKEAPPGALWVDLVRTALARVEGTPIAGPNGPTGEDMAAAEDMPPEQRSAMVQAMVERLAERLKRDGSDFQGWLRLVRAYTVLGDRDKARAAADEARRAIGTDPDKLRRLDELVKGLGLEG
jgi:cytochrome c-type biogenesis protein CcmH